MKLRFFWLTLVATLALLAVNLLSSSDAACGKDGDTISSFRKFFNLYEKHEAVRYDASGNPIMNLRIDSHYPDCGAPDCYGHDMEIQVDIDRNRGKCMIIKAVSRNTTFVCERYKADSLVAGIPPVNEFLPLGASDLSDSSLSEIVFYDKEHNQALILQRHGYSFYEKGFPKEEERDLSKWDGESEWNFPATGADTRWWKTE